ncbi:MAG TPA: pyrrolo-quinoline quinone [Terriglobia bacterium]
MMLSFCRLDGFRRQNHKAHVRIPFSSALFCPCQAASLMILAVSLLAGSMALATDVTTYHNDTARTGQNLQETILTPSNVNSSTFGKLFTVSVDGVIDAQPLYLFSVSISGGTHNVLYTVTENDSVYAFDADTGAPLWQVSVLGAGETPSDTRNCSQITPEIGITSTPVIDRASGTHGTIYVVAMSKNSSGTYFQRLHALDLTTGAEEFGGPVTVQAKYPGMGDNSQGGFVVFDPKQYAERAGLLLLNHVIYTAWTSHCDIRPYTGWLIGYSESTLAQTGVLDVTPNGNEGAIWQAGDGLAAAEGNIYFLDANGTFDTTLNVQGFPNQGDYGNAFVKVSTVKNKLTAADYFTMYNTVAESDADEDLGSGGVMLLPPLKDSSGATQSLGIGAGKDGNIYIVNRNHMGKFNPNNDSAIYQEIDGALPGGDWSMPAFFAGDVYFGPQGNNLLQFQFSKARLSTSPVSRSAVSFEYPGSTPSVSANGKSNGIVWAIEHSNPSVLHAYNAASLATELYNSSQASGGRDQFGSASHFGTPTIVNGKVYVGTTTGVAAFGLIGGN